MKLIKLGHVIVYVIFQLLNFIFNINHLFFIYYHFIMMIIIVFNNIYFIFDFFKIIKFLQNIKLIFNKMTDNFIIFFIKSRLNHIMNSLDKHILIFFRFVFINLSTLDPFLIILIICLKIKLRCYQSFNFIILRLTYTLYLLSELAFYILK